MDYSEAISPIVEGNEVKHVCLGVYLWAMKSIMDYTKKISSSVSLLASIGFNDSYGKKNYIYWIC